MKLLSIILGTFLIFASDSFAEAQSCSGQFQSGQVCNNPTTGTLAPQATFNPVFGNGSNQGSVTLSPGSGSSAPSPLQNGELWTNAVGVFARINGTTVGPFAGATSGSFAATEPITVSFPSNVVTFGFDYSFAGTFLALQSFQANISVGTTGLGNIGQPGTGISVGSSLYPTIVAPLVTTVTATGSSSPNITISAGLAAQTTNGQLISGPVVPGTCCYFVLSGGGTTNIVMSGNASGSGALGATFGLSRYSATSSEIVNTFGVETLLVGAAAVGTGNWTGSWDTPSPFTSFYSAQFVSPNGTHAASFASRQSDNAALSFPSPQTINVLTVIDAVVSAGGWGMYMEGNVIVSGAPGFLQVESDIFSLISNAEALASSNPYTYNANGHTTIYRAGAGAGRTFNGVTSNNISTAFEVIFNLSAFEVGYLCGNTSLDTTGGRVGQCVSMADGQGVTWYTGTGQGAGSGTIATQIYQLLNSTNPILHISSPSNGFVQFDVGGVGQVAFENTVMFPLSNNTFSLGLSNLAFSAVYTKGVEILGSSTGFTTLASLNAGASNFSINLPAASGTVALTSGVVSSVTNVDGTLTISPNVGAVVASCTVATTTQIGCAKFGTGLTITAGNVTPTFGTASGQVAQGGVISAGGPTGSATVAAIITWNAAGQLTAVTSATITPAVGSITGLGSGVATALGVNVGSVGAFVVNGGALGTPSSGTITNLTGTASININGTVGATTPANGTFTNLVSNTSFIITGGSLPTLGQTGISLAYDGVNNFGLIDAATFGSAGQPIVVGSISSQGISVGSKINPGAGSLNLNNNLFMPNLTTTSTAQTATVCWTSGGSPAGKLTGDTTLGCLSSREDWKKYITPLDDELQTEGIDAVGLLMSLQPISYEWINPIDEAQQGKQIGFGAKQVYGVDKRLGGLGSDGIPRAWRQDATLALAVDVLKKLVTEFDEYKRQHP